VYIQQRTLWISVGFEALTAVRMTMLLSWVVTPCRRVDTNVTSSALKMETVCFSETLVSTYESARRRIPEKRRHLGSSHFAFCLCARLPIV
jgi:hypothetical protein